MEDQIKIPTQITQQNSKMSEEAGADCESTPISRESTPLSRDSTPTDRQATPTPSDRSSLSASSSSADVSVGKSTPRLCDGTALLAAIVNFDGLSVSNIIKANPGSLKEVRTYSKHYRSALHELCINYASFDMLERPRAANIHFRDIFNTLLDQGALVNEVRYCLDPPGGAKRTIRTDIKQKSCLHFICSSRGNSDIIKFILSIDGANINAVDSNGQTALHIAVTHSSLADIATLLQHRIDTELLDMHGLSALHVACKKKRNHEVVDLLTQHCDINSQQRSQNHRGSPRSFHHLVASLFPLFDPGSTPLHVAVRQMALSNVETLVSHRVRVNVKDSSGQTPLHLAASCDITGKIVAILIACDANVNSQDELFRDTPLHKACKHNMINAICNLVNNKANIKIANANGQTPVHIAASYCQDHIVWAHLLRQTSNLSSFNIPDHKMKTPLEISECQHNNIARSYIKLYE